MGSASIEGFLAVIPAITGLLPGLFPPLIPGLLTELIATVLVPIPAEFPWMLPDGMAGKYELPAIDKIISCRKQNKAVVTEKQVAGFFLRPDSFPAGLLPAASERAGISIRVKQKIFPPEGKF
jgi:hypothetical protein